MRVTRLIEILQEHQHKFDTHDNGKYAEMMGYLDIGIDVFKESDGTHGESLPLRQYAGIANQDLKITLDPTTGGLIISSFAEDYPPQNPEYA